MNSFIGTKEAAQRLKISVRRVQALIAAGRLPAEKIGNSFAIRESELRLFNPRKNGRPVHERTQGQWNQLIDKIPAQINRSPRSVPKKSKEKTPRKIYISKRLMEKPPSERTPEDWNIILSKVLGTVALGPRDLSTNKKYMEGFGRDNAYRR